MKKSNFFPELDMRASLQGRLDNTPLPYKEGLMAVKEAVVNAIQAIDLASVRDGHVVVTIHSIRCHTNFRHPFNLSWSGKTCDIRRSSKTTS